MGVLGSSNTAATCLLVWGTYEALQRRHSVKWCAVAWGQRFSDLAVLVGLVNFVIVKGTHVYLVLGESVRKEGSEPFFVCRGLVRPLYASQKLDSLPPRGGSGLDRRET